MEDREGLRRAKKKSEWRKNEDWGGEKDKGEEGEEGKSEGARH